MADQFVQKYADYMENVATKLGAFGNDSKTELSELLQFEIALAKVKFVFGLFIQEPKYKKTNWPPNRDIIIIKTNSLKLNYKGKLKNSLRKYKIIFGIQLYTWQIYDIPPGNSKISKNKILFPNLVREYIFTFSAIKKSLNYVLS